MNNPLTNIVQDWIQPSSNVIDFGCGDGSLLQELREHKQTIGYGIEIDPEGIVSCLKKNIPVIEKNIDDGIDEFSECSFDVAIMASSIQCLKEPNVALDKILNLSDKCIVTIPNLGYWRCRLALLLGRMPVTPSLPSSWYGTENIHLCTIKDFEDLSPSKQMVKCFAEHWWSRSAQEHERDSREAQAMPVPPKRIS